VIRSGDTLGSIASRFGTTVGMLLRLNPGVEPTALIPGEQVRIR
jgi:LysM repeat protein